MKMAIGALHHGRAVLKTAVADGGITDESWVAGLRGWFESFVEGLASGPPALRAEQLAALARAGVVSFVGPDPKFGLDRGAGHLHGGFALGANDGAARAARTMVEALAPANRVAVNESPLLEQLLADGLVRPAAHDDGGGRAGAGLRPGRQPASLPAGGRQRRQSPNGLYVLGLQLSASQWGTAIAAEAVQQGGPVYRSGQRTLRDADEIARAILGLLIVYCPPSRGLSMPSGRAVHWTYAQYCPVPRARGGHVPPAGSSRGRYCASRSARCACGSSRRG